MDYCCPNCKNQLTQGVKTRVLDLDLFIWKCDNFGNCIFAEQNKQICNPSDLEYFSAGHVYSVIPAVSCEKNN